MTRRTRHRLGGLLVFATALLLRLIAWQATPDAAWAGSARYVGDAALWVEQAATLAAGEAWELGLPLRPPANAWLLSLLGVDTPRATGGALRTAHLVWCLLGALVAWAAWRAARRPFGFGPALATGLVCAGSTALITLSTSLNNETPYLLVALATLVLGERMSRSAKDVNAELLARAAAWGLLAAAGCLLRVEHLLFAAAATVWLLWVLPDRRRRVLLTAGAVFVVALLPWHLSAWDSVHRFNTVPPDDDAERLQRQLEGWLDEQAEWTPEARAERAAWPAFARRTAANFVSATVLHRGGRRVAEEDLEILRQAFGSPPPQPLGGHPFVALYGGLNFHLANHAGAGGGFSRRPLEQPPPLAGGPGRYPPQLVRGLPPDELTFAYPPHLAVVNHGGAMGWRWMRENPADALRLAGEKLRRFWAGASLGLTGYGLPLGEAGVRWPVDLAVPRGGGLVTAWRLLLLAAVLAGLVVGLRAPERRRQLLPWLLFGASRLAVAVIFFGYARLGATTVPVIALLLALAAARWLPELPPKKILATAAAAAALLVAVEAVRFVHPPELQLDGRTVTARNPFPADDPEERTLTVER